MTQVLRQPPAQALIEPDPVGPSNHIVLESVSWDYYQQTTQALMETRWHVNYHRGRLEIMMLGNRHEIVKKHIARLLELYSLERDIRIEGHGSVTCQSRNADSGLEPDECYYVSTVLKDMPDGPLDLDKYPPPDLAVEVDITRSVISRLPIYAALRVREVWRFSEGQIVVLHLQADGTYQPAAMSLALPALSLEVFNRFVNQSISSGQFETAKAFRDWLRSNP
jgi:Uma2 family endonuclease